MNKKSLMVGIALFSVYVLWGSTYLAIKIAIEDIPPFFMAGSRNLAAGLIMFIIAFCMGDFKTSKKQWSNAFIAGGFLLLLGNGCVVLAEKTVPSGMAALLIATEPLWILLVSYLAGGKHQIGKVDIASMILGFLGVILLLSQNFTGTGNINIIGVIFLLIASFSWAIGSVIMQKRTISDNPIKSTGMLMLAGGTLLTLASIITGEIKTVNLADISSSSLTAQIYLILFGSLLGFSAYTWLLKNTTITVASTYAFVNPVVAMFLGFFIANEQINNQTLSATAVIVMSVILIVMKKPVKGEQLSVSD